MLLLRSLLLLLWSQHLLLLCPPEGVTLPSSSVSESFEEKLPEEVFMGGLLFRFLEPPG